MQSAVAFTLTRSRAQSLSRPNPRASRVDQTWRESAACSQADSSLFFPSDDGAQFDPAPAKAVCNQCSVRAECLLFAIEVGENDGIWGGMNPGQRRAYRLSRVSERWRTDRAERF